MNDAISIEYVIARPSLLDYYADYKKQFAPFTSFVWNAKFYSTKEEAAEQARAFNDPLAGLVENGHVFKVQRVQVQKLFTMGSIIDPEIS